uniref:Glycosyltransferase n=1 Tax=Camellia sinensis var. assamica TaxID=261999 RepID=A0A7M3UQF7_CAMSB|nr:UDP-glycosyltransferase [Camellia sinensis var. assamica]
MVHGHILLLTFPAQGHINPALQFAKRLIKMGLQVTFATSVFAQRRISKTTGAAAEGLKFAAFSDGYDDGFRLGNDVQHMLSETRNNSSRILREIIAASAAEGRPITCLVYTLLLPWAAEVARDCHIPSALLWIQPATVLDIYYYYFNGYGEEITKICKDPSCSIELPGLPSMTSHDLPSFIVPSSSEQYSFALPTFKEQLEKLDSEANPKVLVNTFDALEPEALKAVQKYNLIGIGPLIPSAFLDGKDPSDTSFGGDLFHKSGNYIQWLSSKPESSVIYVSFGSLLVLPKPQMEEIAGGLLQSNRPFLWVIRSEEEEKEEDRLSCIEEVKQQGMIVPWCSQVEVLSHPSLGCFVTHCGWNSTLESLASGVPVVAFPHWTDQGTNAKLIEDEWKTGVRVKANEEGIVEGDEIKRCVEMAMEDGEKGEEMRSNAKIWKDLAREAVKEGGSSNKNLMAFVEEVGGCF